MAPRKATKLDVVKVSELHQMIDPNCDSFQVVSHFKDGFGIVIPELDENGDKVFQLDANGNSKVQKFKLLEFQKVHVKDPETGKISTKHGYCTFVASREQYGRYFDSIVKELNRLERDVSNKLYNMDGHFEKRNPEAYRIDQELRAKNNEIDNLKATNKALMEKLGLSE